MKFYASLSSLAFALLMASFPPKAMAAPITFAELFEKPLVRLLLLHTSEGATLSSVGITVQARNDEDLVLLARKFEATEAKDATKTMEIRVRLEKAEAALKEKLSTPTGDSMSAMIHSVTSISKGLLTLDKEASLASRKAVFLSEAEPSEGLAAARARFIEGQSLRPISAGADLSGLDLHAENLAGRDLRFTRWKATKAGDLEGSDLRGADLRGMDVAAAKGKLRGAIYDQYTALPFTKAEAASEGMVYRSSAPLSKTSIEGSYWLAKLEGGQLSEQAAAAAAVKPLAREELATKVFKEIPAKHPEQAKGVELFEKAEIPNLLIPYLPLEIGRITQAEPSQTVLAELITEISAAGGEVRRLMLSDLQNGELVEAEFALFRMDGDLPVICLTPHAGSPAMAHEREHFRDWMKLQKSKGVDMKKPGDFFTKLLIWASLTAEFSSPEFVLMTERHAVRAEMRERMRLADAEGLPRHEWKNRFENPDGLSLLNYPESEFLVRQLAASGPDPKAQEELSRIIRRTLLSRRQRFLRGGMTEAAIFTTNELLAESVGSQFMRFENQGVLPKLQQLFESALPEAIRKLPNDGFKKALSPR